MLTQSEVGMFQSQQRRIPVNSTRGSNIVSFEDYVVDPSKRGIPEHWLPKSQFDAIEMACVSYCIVIVIVLVDHNKLVFGECCEPFVRVLPF